MDKITINGNEYKLRYTLKALFIFEQITKKPFKIETLLDNYIFFYSLLLANNTDCKLEWDDFINALDDDPTIFTKMSDIVTKQQKKDDIFNSEEEEKEGEQKKS